MYGFSAICERKLPTSLIVLLFLELFLNGAKATRRFDVERHLHRGIEYMEQERPEGDSVKDLHADVDSNPDNYHSYFSRGMVYMELNKPLPALQHLDKVLLLQPDFTDGRLQRGKLHMKMGQYSLAEKDFFQVLEEEPFNDVAYNNLDKIQQAKQQWMIVESLTSKGVYNNSIPMLNNLIALSPWSTAFRQLRADAYILQNDYESAITELKTINDLSVEHDAGFFNTKFCMKSKTKQKTRYLKQLWCDDKSQRFVQNFYLMVLNLLLTFGFSLRFCLI